MYTHATMKTLTLACLCLASSGCMGWFIGDPHRHAYVTRMGSADAMGSWTMKQVDGQLILDGLQALSERIGSTHDNAEAQRATDWFVRIVQKIYTWPEDYALPAYAEEPYTTKTLLEDIFKLTASNAVSNPPVEALYRRICPDEKYPVWRAEWEKRMATLLKAQNEIRINNARYEEKTLQNRVETHPK